MGMCFFAGGMRFTQQDLDGSTYISSLFAALYSFPSYLSAATQIHSSLLSLSVGAVLLPAAFHFTLTYRSGESVGASIEEQKQDILRMSHGVSNLLSCRRDVSSAVLQVSVILIFSMCLHV